jgi:2,5-dioxopentanoate dehydrogenase
MNLSGANYIGYDVSAKGSESYTAYNPSSGEDIEGEFSFAIHDELIMTVQFASAAFIDYRKTSAICKAEFLEEIANEIMNAGDQLINRCVEETGLPAGRITGERARTCGQLQMFARHLRSGWWVDARIDTAQPHRQPPRPDIRRMLQPLGPVVVFGASNFPLAFSVGGGDTASALAAGCPVIVKAHPSHPGTGEIVAAAIQSAAQKTGMPEGVFSFLHLSNEMAIQLVQHPIIQAVGFTGSRKAGLAINEAARQRKVPIPVFAEMSSVNPVIVLENALQEKGNMIAQNLMQSVTLGAGQFCTNPGLVFVISSEAADQFVNALADWMKKSTPVVMLNKLVCSAYRQGLQNWTNIKGVQPLTIFDQPENNNTAIPAVFITTAKTFLHEKQLSEEVFGPATMIVQCRDKAELRIVLQSLEGQLTVAVHAAGNDEKLAAEITDIVTQKAGRIIYNGFPTGVEVCDAMQHGGPYPSTTDAHYTSVGTAAIQRFARPVAFQDFPDALLPEPLQNSNPLGILRLLNGEWTNETVK